MLKITGDVYLLGDPHGCFKTLFRKIKQGGIKNATIICVGDYGAGHPTIWNNTIEWAKEFNKLNIDFYTIRGNHDDPSWFCGGTWENRITFLKDYTWADVNGEKWLLIGGATSVDRPYSISTNAPWWREEVFNYKPELVEPCDVLITHTGPNWIGPRTKTGLVKAMCDLDPYLWAELQEERAKLDAVFEIAKPKRAYMGHFHESSTNTVDGCRARILNIDELIKYE